ncbi:hypothetical protein ACQ4PT_031816 [Festuca glaucescens]
MVGRGSGQGSATASKGRELDLVVGNEAVGAVSGKPRERNAVVGMVGCEQGRGDAAATGDRREIELLASQRDFEKCSGGGGGTSGASSCGGIKRYFDADLAKGQGDTQQTMEAYLNKAEYAEYLVRAWSKWFHANDIPSHKANCPYFKANLKLMMSLPKGVPLPRGIDISGKFLQSNYDDLQEYMAAFKNDWDQYGVTVMCDSWTWPSRMNIINFMFFCNGRMHFHKFVNSTGCVQNHQYVLAQIRKLVVKEIGEKFVV